MHHKTTMHHEMKKKTSKIELIGKPQKHFSHFS